MKIIYKYELSVHDEQRFHMPLGYQLLTVQIQRGKPCIWALVDTTFPDVPVDLLTYGTGGPVPGRPGLYAGTYQLENGGIVFHVFERTDIKTK